jgi:serine/threonine protein phosphatase PrpC
VPGARHTAAGRANQDAWLYRPVTAETFVLAVADGAGSRPRAGLGSQLAVEVAYATARATLPSSRPDQAPAWSAWARQWAGACVGGFARAAQAAAGPLSAEARLSADDVATTLLAVLACPPWYCFVTIGDCFAVVGRRSGGAYLVVPPAVAGQRGATTFLSSPDVLQRISFGVIDEPHLTGLALCSDGLIEATLDTARQADGTLCYVCPPEFAGFFDGFADSARPAGDLAATLTAPEYAAASGDDMTMVLAVRL